MKRVKARTLRSQIGRVCVSEGTLSPSPHTLFPQETLILAAEEFAYRLLFQRIWIWISL
uniref:Uncharacterized protein n=1 Tax=Rousettus aegyptiacus TaxID=9407 RepID=A0A7J8H9V2_ROUAE|nr:hypothetical protein HJG63_020553 [Rousettus aegyptiacus]